MGSSTTYKCKKCDRDWVDDSVFFYLMDDDTLEESGIVMMTYEIERRSIAQGFVCDTYCKSCDKDIKLYILTDVKTHYPHIDANRILEEYKHDPTKIFGTVEEYKKGTKVSCPHCHKQLILEESYNSDDEFNLNCKTCHAYCSDCDERYTFYGIKSPRRDYTKEEVLEKIGKLLDENCLLGLPEEYDNKRKILCPCCGKKIPKKLSYKKCPKCGGKFDYEIHCMYD